MWQQATQTRRAARPPPHPPPCISLSPQAGVPRNRSSISRSVSRNVLDALGPCIGLARDYSCHVMWRLVVVVVVVPAGCRGPPTASRDFFFLLSPARKRSRGRDLSARGAGQVACGRVSRAVPRQSHSSASRRRPAWLLAGKLGRGGGVCDLRCGTTVTLVEVLWMSSLLRTCVCLVLVSRYLVWLPGASSSNCQQTWQAHSYCCI